MKKITILFLLLFTVSIGYTQCLTSTNGQWPAATSVPNGANCDGFTIQNVTTCGYASEYSVVTVVSGQTYVFSSYTNTTPPLTVLTTDVITISTDAGLTAVTFGIGSVTWVATISGNIRFYTHLDATCAAQNTCRTKTVTCGIPSADAPDYANLQFPGSATFLVGGTVTVYGQVYEAGLTDVVPNVIGQAPGITAWVGYSTTNTNPNTWTNWTAATWNSGSVGNNDEYQLTIGATLAPGTYYYATRFRLNTGPYVYGGIDTSGNGNFWNGTTFNSGVLTVTPPPPPANDLLVNATAITCGTIYTGNTTYATIDEANATLAFGVDLDAPNVWYKYTGTGIAESITLNLCGSGYDTSVLVLTGTSGSLTAVAGNDDDASCTTNGLNSKTTFTSDGTTTYYIAVEGYNPGNFGAYTMNVTCSAVTSPAVANQSCATSLTVNVNGVDVNSDNSFGTVNAAQPTCDPFGVIQDVWFSFVAPTSGNVDCLVTNGTMTSANFNIYTGDCFVLTPIAAACNQNLTVATTESLTGLTAGNTYYVQVWSNAAEQGTFTLRLSDPGLGTTSFDNENFVAYPNPVKDILNLSYTQNISKVQVITLLGQEVMTKSFDSTSIQLDMSTLTTGVYLVNITSDNQVKTIKVIKQ